MVTFGVAIQPDPDDDHKYPVEYLFSAEISDLIKDGKPWQWLIPDTTDRSTIDPEDTPRPES